MKIASNKQGGFSLVGVCIAAALLSFIMLGVATMISGQSKNVALLEDRLSKVDLTGQILGKLSDRAACTNTLQGYDVLDEQDVPIIKDKDNSISYNVNNDQKNRFDRLKVNDIKLLNESLNNGPNETGQMRIQVFSQRTRGEGGLKDLAPFDIWLKAETDDTGQIETCYAYSGGDTINTYDEARDCGNSEEGSVKEESGSETKTIETRGFAGFETGGNEIAMDCTYQKTCINGGWRVTGKNCERQRSGDGGGRSCGPGKHYAINQSTGSIGCVQERR